MKSKIQMRRAKHMIAIWLKPGDKESLKDAFDTAKRCWNRSSQRVLKTWAKELYKNPERYEFTGMAHKELKLEDFFTEDDCQYVLDTVQEHVSSSDKHYAIRSIIQHKWVYELSTDYAIQYGLEAYFGKGLKFRPKRPVLKGIK